ncbi:MAG: ribonuclease HII [Treponema sp.]|jgi:ribonuclease HII|nr:ribonuclease HII [Treponema sp.]
MLCGLDEAGRGPLAGPVCAGAVILPRLFPTHLLNDSKKLSPIKREAARRLIEEGAVAWGIGWASHEEIDAINILQASLLAMQRAFEAMLLATKDGTRRIIMEEIDEVIVDGTFVPDIAAPCRALVKADTLIPAVMAASILAKTARDEEMLRYAARYPQYAYEKHKGYPTEEHRRLIALYGASPIQRLSFRHG